MWKFWFWTVLIVVLSPVLVAVILKLTLRKFKFSITPYGFFYFRNFSMTISKPKFDVVISVGKVFPLIASGGIILQAEDVHIQLKYNPEYHPKIKTKIGPIRMLFIRMVIMILASFLKVMVIRSSFSIGILTIAQDFSVCEIKSDYSSAKFKLKLRVHECEMRIEGIEALRATPISLSLKMPPFIDLEDSFNNSTCKVYVGYVSGITSMQLFHKLQTIPKPPKNPGRATKTDLPKISIGKIRGGAVYVDDVLFTFSGLSAIAKTKRTKTVEITATELVGRDMLGIVCNFPSITSNVDFFKDKVNVDIDAGLIELAARASVARFITSCIPVQTGKQPSKPEKDLYFNINIMKLNLDLYSKDTKLLKGSFNNTELMITKDDITKVTISNGDMKITSLDDFNVVSMDSFRFLIMPTILDFRFDNIKLGWHLLLYHDAFPSIMDIIKEFREIKHKNSGRKPPKQDVRLTVTNISALVAINNQLSVKVDLDSFTGDIYTNKSLKLNFSNVRGFIKDKIEEQILECENVSVSKSIDSSLTSHNMITINNIATFIPQLHFGNSFTQIYKSIIDVVSWTLCFFYLGKPVPADIKIPEKSRTFVRISDYRMIAEEDIISSSVRKKLIYDAQSIMQDNGINIQSIQGVKISPFLIFTLGSMEVTADNSKLYRTDQILAAIQNLDTFPVPEESFFDILRGYDLLIEAWKIGLTVRDYPYKMLELRKFSLQGRNIVSKNRLELFSWARTKLYNDLDIKVSRCKGVAGLCVASTIMELVKKMMSLKFETGNSVIQSSATPQFSELDRMRYSMHGKIRIVLERSKFIILCTDSPYVLDGATVRIQHLQGTISTGNYELETQTFSIQHATYPILQIPQVNMSLNMLFKCQNENHWVMDTEYNKYDIFQQFRASEVDIIGSVELPVVEENGVVICYDNKENAFFNSAVILHVKPPPHLKFKMQKSKPAQKIEMLSKVRIEKAKAVGLRVIMITEKGMGLQVTIDNICGEAELQQVRDKRPPWQVQKATGMCSNIHMAAYNGEILTPLFPLEFETYKNTLDPRDFQFSCEGTIMTLVSVIYNYGEEVDGVIGKHCLFIDGFRLLWTKPLENTLGELFAVDPSMLKKRKRDPEAAAFKEEGKVIEEPSLEPEAEVRPRTQPFKTELAIIVTIHEPQICLQNENTLTQLLVIGTSLKGLIYENRLTYDYYGLDLKRQIDLNLDLIQCFIVTGSSEKSVVWIENNYRLSTRSDMTESFSTESILKNVLRSSDMHLKVVFFGLPFSYMDFALNKISRDMYMWHDEPRVNSAHISFPGINTSLESEHFWTLMDVLLAVMLRPPKQHNENVAEALKSEEFRRYGKVKIEDVLKERIATSSTAPKSRILNKLTLEAESLAGSLTKDNEAFLSVEISKVSLGMSFSSDMSYQLHFDLHRIDMMHNKATVFEPLSQSRESYSETNKMFNFRMNGRYLKGIEEAQWPIIDHIEVYIYPIFANLDFQLYTDIYGFIFPKVEDDKPGPQISNIKSSLQSMKPVNKRKPLPIFFKYVNINEIVTKAGVKLKGGIGVSDTVIKLKSITIQQKLNTAQELIDRYIKHLYSCLVKQVPSILAQNMGISSASDILPAQTPSASEKKKWYNKILKRKRSTSPIATEEEMAKRMQEEQANKLLFGSKSKH